MSLCWINRSLMDSRCVQGRWLNPETWVRVPAPPHVCPHVRVSFYFSKCCERAGGA